MVKLPVEGSGTMSFSSIVREVFSWVKVTLIVFSMTFIFTTFIFQPFVVNGSSMEPTLDGVDIQKNDPTGDYLMVNKSAYIFDNQPQFKDIVVVDKRINKNRTIKDKLSDSPILHIFIDKKDNSNYWVKRVIGEAGDTLEFKNGAVYRNGEKLKETYKKEDMAFPFKKVVVPKEHVYVMGDNRNNSHDSRVIGAIPLENVIGKVELRFFPLHDISMF